MERASVVNAALQPRLAELRDQLLHHAVAPRQVFAGVVPVARGDDGCRSHGRAAHHAHPAQGRSQLDCATHAVATMLSLRAARIMP
jgi:metal-dependent amidase/aminoacylase/carboxypeptidase family protein